MCHALHCNIRINCSDTCTSYHTGVPTDALCNITFGDGSTGYVNYAWMESSTDVYNIPKTYSGINPGTYLCEYMYNMIMACSLTKVEVDGNQLGYSLVEII